jgi:peptidoglycan/xylan/chitin deacetylase (PgdA/CDA1 family)
MELAAVELYQLTYDGNYLKEAGQFGRMEPVSPWMCSDTTGHYQWYPFINLGHYLLANVENPRYQKEFQENLLNGIQRMSQYAKNNPFEVGVPLVNNSNSLVSALATQCTLYHTLTGDTTYINMENNLIDWLFGRNPWGTSMVIGISRNANSPVNPYSGTTSKNHIALSGGLVGGPVSKSTFVSSFKNYFQGDKYERFQSDWAVYHDDAEDFVTNEPTLDGTASLSYLLSGKQLQGVPDKTADTNQYSYGGITRTDETKKQICLVFSGHDFTDGYKTIRQTLKKLNIKASFFFTGDFYRNSKNNNIIKGLQEDKHFLGGNSDKHILYCSLQKRDSMFINKSQFINDLKANYTAMEKFGIKKNQTPFFLPPYEWHNDSISIWCKEVGIQLINFTPGTLSNTDTSIPEMRDNYFSSNEIYNKIIQVESKQGLNGNIMLFHIGSDNRRQDKFYPRLYKLLLELSKYGYDFVDLYKATDIIGQNTSLSDKKQKRKN